MTPQEIKQIRLDLGLTQEAFANFVGTSFVTVSRWENGVFKPSRFATEKLKSLKNKKGKHK